MGCGVSAEGGGRQAQASPSPSHCEEGASAGRAIPGDTVERGLGCSPTCLLTAQQAPLLASGNNTVSVLGCRYSEPPRKPPR